MDEPTPRAAIFGLVAEFETPARLVAGVTAARAAGYRGIDACSPFPVEGLDAALDIHDPRVPWWTLAGGIVGAVVGFGMQVYTNLAYPIDIGGRPLVAPPAFMLITFELTVLFAVLAGIGAMLVLNHLPRLHHPLFSVDSFQCASVNRFFLVLFSTDPRFDRDASWHFLEGLDPQRIDVVTHGEMPE